MISSNSFNWNSEFKIIQYGKYGSIFEFELENISGVSFETAHEGKWKTSEWYQMTVLFNNIKTLCVYFSPTCPLKTTWFNKKWTCLISNLSTLKATGNNWFFFNEMLTQRRKWIQIFRKWSSFGHITWKLIERDPWFSIKIYCKVRDE